MSERKVACITGIGRRKGIGIALADRFAREGYNIVFSYFSSDGDDVSFEEVNEQLSGYGVRVFGREIDFSQVGAARELFDFAKEHFSCVDVLINNAAYSVHDDLQTLESDVIDKHYFVNVRTPMLLVQAFYEQADVEESALSFGRIVNLTSGQEVTPLHDELSYVASKGALDAFMKSVAPMLMAKNITINSVDPGATDTGWMTDEIRKDLAAYAPLKRVGEVGDIEGLIVFLCSEEARHITGQVIHARGGI